MKGKHLLVMVFILLVLASAQITKAQLPDAVEFSIEPNSIKTDLSMPARFLMTVKNNMMFHENFRVQISGPYIHWVTSPIILLAMPKNTIKQFNLTFYPVNHRGTFDFKISILSYKSFDINKSAWVRLIIPPEIVAENFSAQKETDAIVAGIDVETLRNHKLDFSAQIFSGDSLVSSSDSNFDIDGQRHISLSLPFPQDPLAGDYKVKYQFENFTGEEIITVNERHDVSKDEDLFANVWHGDVVVTYTNNGNVVERDYDARETLPGDVITGLITQPMLCVEGDESISCNYVLPDLQPGETAMITYRIEYWPVYVQLSAAVIIVLIIFGFSFLRAAKPSISKTSSKRGRMIHSVAIEIRNPFLHHLKDVVIRDWVTPLAKFAHEEAQSIKPVLKRSEAGTELIWKIGEMKPKETRILRYKINTLVEGNLKMPRAYARFRTPKGIGTRIYSGFLSLS